jgi:hypothetical protein
MIRRKRLSHSVVMALVIAVSFAPLSYAEQSTETIPVAAAAASPANPELAPPEAAVASEASGETLPEAVPVAFPASPGPLRLASTWSPTGVANARVRSYRFQVEPAATSPVRGRSPLSKKLIIIGGAVAVSGGAMVAFGSNGDEVGDSSVAIEWDTMGLIWIGAGLGLVIWGLIKG